GRISSADYSGASAPVGTMVLPKRVEHRQPRVRRDLASALRTAAAGLSVPGEHGRSWAGAGDNDGAYHDPEVGALRARLRGHPGQNTAGIEERMRQTERSLRIERDNEQLQKKVAAATNSLARTFDQIVGLLTERGFIEGPASDPRVTDDGRLLARIYSESDLLIAECLRTGAWAGLRPAELAAVVSAGLYETRRGAGPGPPFPPAVPPPRLGQALLATWRLSTELGADEQTHRIGPSREPDDGFVRVIYRWARSGDLAATLAAADETGNGSALSAGDFVRWCRQVLDL